MEYLLQKPDLDQVFAADVVMMVVSRRHSASEMVMARVG
jgi:hypothetical protein